LAFLIVMDKWRSYLHINPFVIRTNHQSLYHLQDQTLSTELQRNAMRKLAGLQFKVGYKKGCENKVTDALSQVGIHFHAISAVVPMWVQEVTNTCQNDPVATTLLQDLTICSPND
jgi:hypothetical protein